MDKDDADVRPNGSLFDLIKLILHYILLTHLLLCLVISSLALELLSQTYIAPLGTCTKIIAFTVGLCVINQFSVVTTD